MLAGHKAAKIMTTFPASLAANCGHARVWEVVADNVIKIPI